MVIENWNETDNWSSHLNSLTPKSPGRSMHHQCRCFFPLLHDSQVWRCQKLSFCKWTWKLADSAKQASSKMMWTPQKHSLCMSQSLSKLLELGWETSIFPRLFNLTWWVSCFYRIICPRMIIGDLIFMNVLVMNFQVKYNLYNIIRYVVVSSICVLDSCQQLELIENVLFYFMI